MAFRRQVGIPLRYKNVRLDCGYRVDLMVADALLVEVKAVERLLPVHSAQLLTYLRLTGVRTGLLINFNAPTLVSGLRRLVQG